MLGGQQLSSSLDTSLQHAAGEVERTLSERKGEGFLFTNVHTATSSELAPSHGMNI